ncbi:MAG: hypothetical protein GY810_16610 [Aureispira sp.]|nr:hypothetical protein [Aureispira sp.]
MPSHYIYSITDLGYKGPERVEFSEDFYGLMGGGITALFDQYPAIFDQIEKLGQVNFDSIMPLYHCQTFEDADYMQDYLKKNNYSWQDILQVKEKFTQLFNNLCSIPNLAEQIVLKEGEYGPDKAYFMNIGSGQIILEFETAEDKYELYQKYYPDLDEDILWCDYVFSDKLKILDDEWNLGHDICALINYINKAIEKGAKKIRLNGR